MASNVQTASPTTQPTPIVSPLPSKAPMTLEDKIKTKLTDGESVTVSDAVDIDTNKPILGKRQADITTNLGSGFWNIKSAKTGVQSTAAKLVKDIFPLDDSLYAIQITANVPTTNAYGKSEMSQLVLIIITRDTYNKIQWNNFDYHNLPTIADTYYENNTIK